MPSTDFIFHVDVAYIPYHGHEHYVDKDFFRRIRAEYYILNAVETSRRTLESLIEGKQEWESNEQVNERISVDLFKSLLILDHSCSNI